MQRRYLYSSIGLHIMVFLLLVFDLPFLHRPKITMGQAPIIVDLKDVKLAEMTNLPPKAVFGDEDKKATVPEKKKSAPKWTTEEVAKQELPPPPKETKVEQPKSDFLDTTPPEPAKKPVKKPDTKPVPKPAKKPAPKPAQKPQPKPEPKPQPVKKTQDKTPPVKPKTAKKPASSANTLANPLKSLMDSVSSLEKELGETASPAVIKKGTEVANMGVEGGTGGSYFSELTISETDAIAGRLRECWNLDPGARGIEDMVIEIRAYVNRDGTIRDVQILDKSRYNSDPHFRAIAESARRAVYSCMNHNGTNIYKIFPQKYADKYDLWNTLLLRFNPMDASIK